MKNGILDGQIDLFDVESKRNYTIQQSRKSEMVGYVINRNAKEDDSKNKYLIFKNDRYCWGETIELENLSYSLDYAIDLVQWLVSQEKYKSMIQEKDIYISEIKLLGKEKKKIIYKPCKNEL